MATPIPENRADFGIGELLQLTGGRVSGGASTGTGGRVCGVVTDSRRVTPGCLFVALCGEHFDAHRFLPEVAEAGAAAALVAVGHSVPAPVLGIEVPDPLAALGQIAARHRRRWGGRVVAITGSAGKTTTKELTAEALSATGLRVARTAGNLNNLIGVPMTLLTLDAGTEVAVVEMGTSAPGEIATLAVMADPDVGVVTTVSMAHAEGLGSLAGVVQEKLSLLAALGRHGVAVYGCDSDALRRYATLAPLEGAWSFGRSEDADSRLVDYALDAELRGRCRYLVRDRAHQVTMRMLGLGPALDGAAALAVVAAVAGLDGLPAACHGIAQVAPVSGRLSPEPGPSGSLVIDDSYNANPASVRSSLATLVQAARARGGRAIAVLGDMKELGAAAHQEHAAVGAVAADLGVDRLLLCGEAMAAAEYEAPGVQCTSINDALSALPELSGSIASSDVVLVKGSRSMGMERLVRALRPSGAVADGTVPEVPK